MEESDIKRQHLELLQWVYMTCCLMEQCLGDQQFVTLLLYLDDIYIFAPTIDDMLDHIELVFNRLKELNLKFKP